MGAQVSAQSLAASASSAFTISVSWWEMEDWDEDPVSPVSGKTGEVLSFFFLPSYDQSETDPFPGPIPLLPLTGSPLFPGVSQEVDGFRL